MDQASSPRAARIVLVGGVLVTVALVAVLSYSFGLLRALGDPDPLDTSAEAGFARDMQVHHNQGVELAYLVRDRTDDSEVRLLAFDIATTQGQQSGQMYGWLTEWGLAQASSEPSMTWMTRPGRSNAQTHSMTQQSDQPMPGLATPAQIAELSRASGVDAERIFLALMIAHHKGAVEMAEGVTDRATNPSVLTLARSIMDGQKSELESMIDMLERRS